MTADDVCVAAEQTGRPYTAKSPAGQSVFVVEEGNMAPAGFQAVVQVVPMVMGGQSIGAALEAGLNRAFPPHTARQ